MPRPRPSDAATAAARAARTDAPFLPFAAGIFVLALLVRLTHVWLLSRSPYFTALLGDAHGYDEWARRIAAGEWIGKDVFYQAPLYPYVLGIVYRVFGHSLMTVRIIQALVGAGSCALLGLAGHRFFSARVGLFAGIALAIYAPAIFFDALIQKSVLDLFFITLSLWLVARLVDQPRAPGGWLALGAAMGGLSLTRENALAFVAVIIVWALLRSTVDDGRVVLKPWIRASFLVAYLVGLAIVLLPVAVRNEIVSGGFYLTTSQFGPNLFIGNNPKADGTYMSLRYGRGAPEYERIDATELAEHAVGHPLTPGDVSGYWTSRALDFITGHPASWLALQGRKLVLLLNATEMLDTESQDSHAEWSWLLRAGGWFGHFGLLMPLALIGLTLAWPDRRRLGVLYAMMVVYSASVLLFYVFARYRLPLVPMLLLFAASGLVALPDWLRHSTRQAQALLAGGVVAVAVFANWPVLSRPLMMAITETNLAGALQAEGHSDEAATHYRKAIAIQPDYAPAYNNLGVMERADGQVDEAIATYRQALALKGDYPDAHYNLANALLAKNQPVEAAEHFQIALRSIPDSAGVSNNLGIALAALNRPTDAVAAFRSAVAAEPTSTTAHRNLADALSSTGQLQEATTEYRRAIELAPNDPAAHYNLGVMLLQAGKTKEAIVEMRATLAASPQSVDAHNNLGIALGSSGDLDGAVAEFRRALAIRPDAPEARQNLQMAEQALAQTRSGAAVTSRTPGRP